MTFNNEYDGEDNYIVVNEWVGKIPDGEPDFIYPDDEYYYQIEMICDDNDAFKALSVKKVGGGDDDSARGGEWYEKMDDDDIEMIINYVKSECF